MVRCYIAIGSNLDSPLEQVQQGVTALKQLPHSQLRCVSPWYQNKAVGPGEQPDYINGVVSLDTELSPTALLHALQHIENNQHRVRAERWGPRTLDLDILLYGEQTVDNPQLSIPHPRMKERNFVIVPLFDIAPQLQLPDGTLLSTLISCLATEGMYRVNDSRQYKNPAPLPQPIT